MMRTWIASQNGRQCLIKNTNQLICIAFFDDLSLLLLIITLINKVYVYIMIWTISLNIKVVCLPSIKNQLFIVIFLLHLKYLNHFYHFLHLHIESLFSTTNLLNFWDKKAKNFVKFILINYLVILKLMSIFLMALIIYFHHFI